MDFRVVSIGAMAANPIWNERAPVRTGHSTTTLIRSGGHTILVDPGLPAQALVARLHERTGLAPSDITDVFLTSFHPDTHRGIGAFEKSRWLIGPEEREAVGVQMATALKDLMLRREDQGGVAKDQSLQGILEAEVALLRRCEPAPQSLADRVDVFPLPGVTPGLCGLLLSHPRLTVVVAGDAIPTQEHLEQGRTPQQAADVGQGKESFEEVVEIADLIVLGRDNVVVNPTKRPF